MDQFVAVLTELIHEAALGAVQDAVAEVGLGGSTPRRGRSTKKKRSTKKRTTKARSTKKRASKKRGRRGSGPSPAMLDKVASYVKSNPGAQRLGDREGRVVPAAGHQEGRRASAQAGRAHQEGAEAGDAVLRQVGAGRERRSRAGLVRGPLLRVRFEAPSPRRGARVLTRSGARARGQVDAPHAAGGVRGCSN